MFIVGIILLAFAFILRFSVKNAIKKVEEDLFLSSVLNKTATAETGLYYTGRSSGKALNTYCFVAMILCYLSFIIGLFCFGGGFVMIGH